MEVANLVEAPAAAKLSAGERLSGRPCWLFADCKFAAGYFISQLVKAVPGMAAPALASLLHHNPYLASLHALFNSHLAPACRPLALIQRCTLFPVLSTRTHSAVATTSLLCATAMNRPA